MVPMRCLKGVQLAIAEKANWNGSLTSFYRLIFDDESSWATRKKLGKLRMNSKLWCFFFSLAVVVVVVVCAVIKRSN